MGGVTLWDSVVEKITAAFKNRVDFGWLRSSGCSLHHQETVGDVVRSVTSGASEGSNHWLKQLGRGVQRESWKKKLEGKYLASSFCLIFTEVRCKLCDVTHGCWKLVWRAYMSYWIPTRVCVTWFWTILQWEISWHKTAVHISSMWNTKPT